MKKKWVWLIFLVIGVICAAISRCRDAHAEGWTPPEWVDDLMNPDNTPEPILVPAVSEAPQDQVGSGNRGIPNDGEYGTISYKAGYWFRLLNGTQATVVWRDVWGGVTRFNPNAVNPWCLYISDGTTTNNEVFENDKSYSNTNGNFNENTAINSGIDFSVTYTPNSDQVWNNEMQFTYSCRWNLGTSLSENQNAAYTLEDLNIDYSEFQNNIPVTIYYMFRYIVNGTSKYIWVRDDVLINDLASYSFTFDASDIPDDTYIKSVTVHVIVNYDSAKNYIVNLVKNWYYQHDPTITNIPYPYINYNARSTMHCKLKIAYTDNAKNRSWLANLLNKLFIPDSQTLTDIVNNAMGDPSSNGSQTIMTIRERLYDMINQNNPSDFEITIPPLSIPINGRHFTFFNGYTFSAIEFYRGTINESSPFRNLVKAVNFITSALIFSLFFRSIWIMFVRVFGLNLWQGANGDDKED